MGDTRAATVRATLDLPFEGKTRDEQYALGYNAARCGQLDRCHKPLMRNLLRSDTPTHFREMLLHLGRI